MQGAKLNLQLTGDNPKIGNWTEAERQINTALNSKVNDSQLTPIIDALISDGKIYADTVAGIAATAADEMFLVYVEGGAQVYLNDGGVAVYRGVIRTLETVITEDIVVMVPTDYATIQEAFDFAQGKVAAGRALVRVHIEAGQTWDADTVRLRGAYNAVITSDDPVVYTPAGFPDGSELMVIEQCPFAPRWEILVDMEGRGDNGILLIGSHLMAAHRCGVVNAGANAGASIAFGSNIACYLGSSFVCDPARQTVVSRTGHTASGGTTTTFTLAAEDQQADKYWIGHIINVSNGTDQTDARIVDYDNATNTVTLKYSERWTAPNDGADLSYTIDLLRGAVLSGAARRGLTVTWGSHFSCPAADFRGCGTDPRDTGHTGIFVSRSSWGQCDYSTFVDAARGIRSSRSNLVSARLSFFSYIAGTAISCAEGSRVSAAASDFRKSGLIGTGGDPDLAILWLGSAEGRGGSAAIDAPASEFDFAAGPVVRIDSEGGSIDVADGRAFEINSYLAVASLGNIDVSRVTGTTVATAAAPYVVLAGALNATVAASAFTWDAQGGATYTIRAVTDAMVNLLNANIQGASTRDLDIDEAAQVYFEGTTVGGVLIGATLGFAVSAGCSIPSRADAVSVIAAGWVPPPGTSFTAAGRSYEGKSGATGIPDMPNVSVNRATPAHFASLSDALAAAVVHPLHLDPGAVYDVAGPLSLPASGQLITNDAVFNLTASITAGTPVLDILSGARVIGNLRGKAPAAVSFNKFFRADDVSVSGDFIVTPTDHQPNNNFHHDDLWADLTADITVTGVQTVNVSGLQTLSATWHSADMSFAANVTIPASPSGVIIDMSNASYYGWLGFTGSDIVMLAGASADYSEIRVPYATAAGGASLAGRTGRFYGQIDVSQRRIRLWFYDSDNGVLYGIGEGVGATWTQWAANVDWGFGRLSGTGVPLSETSTNFNGTATAITLYQGEVDLDFEDVTCASQMSSNPDAQNGAVVIRSTGGTGVTLGNVRAPNCDFVLTVVGDAGADVVLRDVEGEGALRVVSAETARLLKYGRVGNVGRSPNAILGHISGQNATLVNDIARIVGEEDEALDMAEHGARVGFGAGDQAPEVRRTRHVSKRSGQSGLKAAAAGGRPLLVQYDSVLVEDAGYRPTDLTRSPGLNEAGVMACVERLSIGSMTVRAGLATFACNHAGDFRGCGEIDVTTARIANPAGHALRATAVDEGGTARALTRMHVPNLIASDVGGDVVRLNYVGADLGDVVIRGQVNGCSGDHYVEIDVNTDVMAITGRVFIDLWVSEVAPVVSPISVTDNAAVPLANLADYFVVRINYFDGTPSATYGTAA